MLLLLAFPWSVAYAAPVPKKSENHVIDVVQMDAYTGTIGRHPVYVVLGNTDREMSGRYHYGRRHGGDSLVLGGGKNALGAWDLQESVLTTGVNPNPARSGQWELRPVAGGWAGVWKKADGTGELPVTLHKEKDAVDYAVLSDANHDTQRRPDAPPCAVRVFRHQKLAETFDASNDTEDCRRTDISFPDLNFDGHADMMFNIDTPAHNYTYSLQLYDPATQAFVDAGNLTQPAVDPVHRNIAVSIHYGAGAHSASIYRFENGKREPTLIEEMIPCSSRDPKSAHKSASCLDNYDYDMKSGKIIGVEE